MKKFEYDVESIDKRYKFRVFHSSTIHHPKNNSIIFLKESLVSLLENLKSVKESIIIVPEGVDVSYLENDNFVIHSKNPRLQYAILMTEILKLNSKEQKTFFQSGYYYGENCVFGNNLLIEPFVQIGHNVRIGDNTIIKSGVKIGNNVTIGENCYIRENSVIGGEGFGIEQMEESRNIRIPHIGGVILEDNVEVGALTTVCSGTIEPTYIQEYVKIDDHVHIGHNVLIKKGSLIVAGTVIGGSTKIGERNWIGINSSIRNGIELEDDVTLGMASVVKRKLTKGIIVAGEESYTLEDVKKYKKYKQDLLGKY